LLKERNLSKIEYAMIQILAIILRDLFWSRRQQA
jgi:hypothetical protein